MTTDPMLTVYDVAHRLNCHESLVRRLLNTGKLVGSRIGKEWRIKPDDLEAFLSRTRTTAPAQVIPISERLPEPSKRRFA